MAGRMERFLATRGLEPKSFADVGCGPAVMLFTLATRFPECQFYGFDASKAVIRMDRRRLQDAGLANLHFGMARLPHAPEGPFDVVTCFATLHYVSEPVRALGSLFNSVRGGGYLVFNYPNLAQRAAYRRDTLRNSGLQVRFALLLAGRNLLSQRVVESTLRRRPSNFWAAVGEAPNRLNPCVVVRR